MTLCTEDVGRRVVCVQSTLLVGEDRPYRPTVHARGAGNLFGTLLCLPTDPSASMIELCEQIAHSHFASGSEGAPSGVFEIP